MTASSSFVAWLHIGDLHASDEDGWDSLDSLSRLIEEVRLHVPQGALDFAFLPGDNANHGEPEQYRRIAAVLDRLPMPRHVIPGDHDFEPGSLDAFATIGTHALPAMVRIAGRRAIFLDIVSAGRGGPDFRIGDEQMAWLRGQLAQAKAANEPRSVVFMHAFPSDLREGAREIARLLAEARVAFVDTGHTHYNELINDGAVVYSATRSTGQTEEGPPGFAVVAVDGDVASWRFKELGGAWPWVSITTPSDARLRTEAARDRRTVRALVLGRDVVTVTTSIDGGPPLPMSPVHGRPSLWQVEADRDLDRAQSLTVVATDGDGVSGEDSIRIADTLKNGDAAWVEHGVLGTKLGPNANGKDW